MSQRTRSTLILRRCRRQLPLVLVLVFLLGPFLGIRLTGAVCFAFVETWAMQNGCGVRLKSQGARSGDAASRNGRRLWMLSDQSTATADVATTNRVYVVVERGEEDSQLYDQVARSIAVNLSIPLLPRNRPENDAIIGALHHPDSAGSTNATTNSASYTHTLRVVPYTEYGIQDYAIGIQTLQSTVGKKTPRKKLRGRHHQLSGKPWMVDFAPPRSTRLRRRAASSSVEDLLLKACRFKTTASTGDGIVIWDLTAGFGQDAFLLAQQTWVRQVVMVERNPIIALLLQDALRRLDMLSSLVDGSWTSDVAMRAEALKDKLSLRVGDGVSVAQEAIQPVLSDSNHSTIGCDEQLPDLVYLDPMFPPRTKSAAVKKNMQILHALLSTQTTGPIVEDDTTTCLLKVALHCAQRRVVVKRPVGAPPLGSVVDKQSTPAKKTQRPLPKPSYEIKGSVNRWDVYSITT